MTPRELKDRLAAGEDLSGTMLYPDYPLPPKLLQKINTILKQQRHI